MKKPGRQFKIHFFLRSHFFIEADKEVNFYKRQTKSQNRQFETSNHAYNI